MAIVSKEQFLTINKDNFASVLNKANNISAVVNDMCESAFCEGKVITEMTIKQQQNKATLEEMRKNIEVYAIPFESAGNIFKDLYKSSVISDEEFQDNIKNIGKELKQYFTEGTSQNNIVKAYDMTCLNDRDKVLNQLNFTKDEYDRLMGINKYEGSAFGDYGFMQGGLKEANLDASILQKIRNCDIKGSDGKYIFRPFLICDGHNNVLKCKNLGFFEQGLVVNFGGLNNENKSEWLSSIIDFTAWNKNKNSKFRGAKTRFLSRVSGLKTIDEELNQYTSQITRPMHAFKTLHSGSEKVMGGVSSLTTSVFNTPNKVKIAKKQHDLNKLLKKLDSGSLTPKARNEILSQIAGNKKEIEKLKEAINKSILKNQRIGNVAHYIWNPHEAALVGGKKLVGAIGKKIANSKLAKNPVGKFTKGIAESIKKPFVFLGKAKNTAFNFVGNLIFNNPFSNVLKKLFKIILNAVKMVSIPVIIIVLIVMTLGVMGDSGSDTAVMMTIMPLSDMSDFKNYQIWYDDYDDNFLKSLENFVQNKTTNTNLKGEHIYYGVNGMNNEEGMKNNDYQNGLYYRYITDAEHEGRSSNIEDLIAMMSIIMGQQQSQFKDESNKVLNWLYNLSHTYTYQESPLYACNSACHNVSYHCYDYLHEYSDTDIRFGPFHALNKSGDDYEIRVAENKCEVCSQFFDESGKFPKFVGGGHSGDCIVYMEDNPKPEDYYGCVSNVSCFHGISANMGRNRPDYCSNYEEIYMCPGHEHHTATSAYITFCSGPLGCQGYYQCDGHPHYTCDGHEYKCCMGHMDIQMNIKIKFYEELKDLVNKYDFGVNDHIASQLNNE